MKFCTAINCMDGRVQLPVIQFLCDRFGAEYVDCITEPGPNLILAKQGDDARIQTILERLDISIHKHGSVGIAVAGHHDCAGNPASHEDQLEHTRQAVRFLSGKYEDIEIIGLWVDENWEVNEI